MRKSFLFYLILLKWGLLVCGVCLLGSCYIARQGMGQMDILFTRESVEDYLAGEASPESKETVRFIQDVKRFGEDEIGLKSTDNFTTVYDTGGDPVSWVVTACRKDRFEPYTWWFPIVGRVPYKGFFNQKDALAQAKELEEAGYDVSVGSVGAYSTLGWFSDPILSTMFGDTREALADLILHEMTHGHIYVSGRGDFNESLASFLGRQASLEYFRRRYGENSKPYQRAIERFADEERFDDFIQALYNELDSFYRSSPSNPLKGRKEIFRRAKDDFLSWRNELHSIRYNWFLKVPLNNSTIMGRRRYGRTELFQKVFDTENGEWAVFWGQIQIAAESKDPFGSLEGIR